MFLWTAAKGTSVDLLNTQFDKAQRPSFSEVLHYYLSDEVTLRFQCSFGPLQKPAVLDEHRELLRMSCFLLHLYWMWRLERRADAFAVGILINPYIQCASPLAARFLTLALLEVDK